MFISNFRIRFSGNFNTFQITHLPKKDTSVEKVISYSNSLKTFLDNSGQTKPILPIFDIPLSCKIRNVLSKFFSKPQFSKFFNQRISTLKIFGNILIKSKKYQL